MNPPDPHSNSPYSNDVHLGVEDDTPPLLSSWGKLYSSIVVYLAVLITLFYWFTAAYRDPR